MPTIAVVQHKPYGECTETPWLGKMPAADRRRDGLILESLLSWRPSSALVSDYLPNRPIDFKIYRHRNGDRVLRCVDDYNIYVPHASGAGLAIMQHLRPETEGLRFSYHVMQLLFDRIRRSRAHLKRQFKTARDLYVRPKGRGGSIGYSLLPEEVGKTADGGGRSWTIHTLTRRGREAALAAGETKANSKVDILYGLTCAAEMNPLLSLSDTQVEELVFASLFNRENLVPVSESLFDDVLERLRLCNEEHKDNTWQAFDKWFAGRKNNLVQTLARKSGFEELSREEVNAALLRISWRSYTYVAGCLNLFAQAVRQGLVEPLNDREREQFDSLYVPQARFGGLALVMMMERGDLFQLAGRRLLDEPTSDYRIGVVHRLLAIYAEMVLPRRMADRRFKQMRDALAAR